MKRPSKTHVAVALAASTVAMGITLAPSSSAATPFVDGGFEPPIADANASGYDTIPLNGTFGAWTVTGGDIDVTSTYWDAAAGAQSVDLDGTSPGTICQDASTVAGGRYRVDYVMSTNSDAHASRSLDVSVDNAVIQTMSHPGSGGKHAMNWQAHSVEFTADNGASNLCFASKTPGTSSASGPAIDEVSLTLINLPPTATITTPAEGAVYFQGQTATSAFSCNDPSVVPVPPSTASTQSVVTCKDAAGNNSPGGPLSTSTVGANSLTVTATDDFGATGTDTNGYTVKQLITACRGLAVGLPLGIRLGDANPDKTPCATKNSTVTDMNTPLIIGSLNVTALNSTTQNAGNGVERAAAGLSKATLSILGLNIVAENLQSQVEAKMGPGCTAVTKSGSSTVGKVSVNGTVLTNLGGGAGTSIPILFGLATLHVNQEIVTPTGITRRALFLDMPGDILDVVIGQSEAGASCGGAVSTASVIDRTKKPSKAEVNELKRQIKEAVAKDKAAKKIESDEHGAQAPDVKATEPKSGIQNA